MKRITRQKGAFSVELAFILVAMSALLTFYFDLGRQVLEKTELDRVSNSLVSVLKERQAFFSDKTIGIKWDISQDDAYDVYKMANNLLGSDKSVIGVVIGHKKGLNDETIFSYGHNRILGCEAEEVSDDLIQGSMHELNLYRVTICSQYESVFNSGIVSSDNEIKVLKSTSLFVGR